MAAEDDVYVAPYLMVGEKRAKGAAVERTKVHADLDGQSAPLDLIGQLGAYAVSSGTPGHAHVYVDLEDNLPAHWHELLCRALGAFLGDADAKVSDNDLLRPPGTLSHKARVRDGLDPTPVEWLRKPSGRRWDAQELARTLGVILPARDAPRTVSPGVTGAVVVVENVTVDALPAKVRDALAEVTGDRSADTMRVVGACHDAGLTLAQARGVVALRSDLAERLADRPDDDVLTCWLKATDSRAERRAADEWLNGLRKPSAEPAHESEAAQLEDQDDATPGAGLSWSPVDVAATVAGLVAGTLTRHKPTIGLCGDDRALFYRGKVNGVAGASGSGKTWTALTACAQQLDAGEHVVYIDLEDDDLGIIGRLLDLGVNPAAITDRFHYVRPEERFGTASAQHLAMTLAEHSPSLVVIDSTGEGMALDGAKPNDDDDTARWFRILPGAIARTGPAVVVLDHVIKADDGGLWPIGSQRKRAAINGAQYMQMTVKAFDKDTAGLAKLVCAKDRHGNYRSGLRVADLQVDPTSGPGVQVQLHSPTEAPAGAARAWRPTGLMERIAAALAASSEPLSFRAIDDRVNGKADHKRAALGVLIAEEFVTVADGPRNARLHTLARPYSQREDPASDLYRPEGTHSAPNECVSVSVSLERDTGHTHSTVSGTHSGHGWDTVPDQGSGTPVVEPVEPSDDRPRCPVCERPMGRTDAQIGTCAPCRRIEAANAQAVAS